MRSIFVTCFFLACPVAEAQLVTVQGCPQYGAGAAHHGWGLPYESWGAMPSGNNLVASVYQGGCYFNARYQAALDGLTFRFCRPGCSPSICDNWYARSSYFNLGTNHSVEILLRVDDFGVLVYPGCEGEAGDWGRTFISTGSPYVDVLVRLTWQDTATGQTGVTWHSLTKSTSKVSGQHLWAYGDDGIYESSSHTNGRTLRIALNSKASVTQGGKQYGVSPSTDFAKLIEVKVHGLVAFESTQNATGIVELQAWAEVDALVRYRHTDVIPGPFVSWIDN